MPEVDPTILPSGDDRRPRSGLVPEPLLELVRQAPMPSLGPGPRYQPLARWLSSNAEAAGQLSPPVRAGLWLLAGDLDASHTISQSIASAEGSFWHGIMHRREGDGNNAKYWFRRVGSHPVLEQLAATDYGDPFDFVDRCQGADDNDPTLLALQWQEWQRLLSHCL